MNLMLSQRTQLSDNLWEYIFTPAKPLGWLSGQFIGIKIPGLADYRQGERQFTIATHPGSGQVRILTRHSRSNFKQTLAAMPTGSHVTLSSEPAGTFTWKQPNTPKILCAAGVGITPFLAMLTDPQTPLGDAPVTLVYGHPATPLPDEDSLEELSRNHPTFRIIRLPDRPTAAILATLDVNLADSLVYVSGIRDATRLMLPPLNVPTSQLLTDDFTGYATDQY